MISNSPIWEDGKPVLWDDVKRPEVEISLMYRPLADWTYSHHPYITVFKDRFYAIWSNGYKDEDAPGQRILLTSSSNFQSWSTPIALASPGKDEDGRERVLTAAGFHIYNDLLIAYYGDYGPEKQGTGLFALTTPDGINWSGPVDMGIPVCSNHGPQTTKSGRLIICGNVSFPYTDDPSGLTGWKMTGIYPPEMAGTKDDPEAFWHVAKNQQWKAALCEGSFYQTDDGILHMLLRATGEGFQYRLWHTESKDDGCSWSEPEITDFSDDNAKFHFGRLPDGRYYYVGNPLAGNRTPLILSISNDGVNFTSHYIIGETSYEKVNEGRWKDGEYGYPCSMVRGEYIYVIVSRQKEGVEVIRVNTAELR